MAADPPHEIRSPPPRFRADPGDQARLGVQEGTLDSRDETRLGWRAWPIPEPRAVVRGLGEHSGRCAALAEALNRRRCGCWAIDLRGIGRSPGRRGHVDRWRQWVEDCAALAELVQRQSPGVEVVPLGHSNDIDAEEVFSDLDAWLG